MTYLWKFISHYILWSCKWTKVQTVWQTNTFEQKINSWEFSHCVTKICTNDVVLKEKMKTFYICIVPFITFVFYSDWIDAYVVGTNTHFHFLWKVIIIFVHTLVCIHEIASTSNVRSLRNKCDVYNKYVVFCWKILDLPLFSVLLFSQWNYFKDWDLQTQLWSSQLAPHHWGLSEMWYLDSLSFSKVIKSIKIALRQKYIELCNKAY